MLLSPPILQVHGARDIRKWITTCMSNYQCDKSMDLGPLGKRFLYATQSTRNIAFCFKCKITIILLSRVYFILSSCFKFDSKGYFNKIMMKIHAIIISASACPSHADCRCGHHISSRFVCQCVCRRDKWKG